MRLRGGMVGRNIWGGRDGGFEVCEGCGGLGFQAAEFGGDAGLDVEFYVFGAGGVGFGAGLEGVDEGLGEADGGFAEVG